MSAPSKLRGARRDEAARDALQKALVTKIPHIFGEAQKTRAGHRKLFNSLRRLHVESIQSKCEIEFMRPFVQCLNRALGAKSRAPAVDRVLDFVHGFISFSREKDRELAAKNVKYKSTTKTSQVVWTGESNHAPDAEQDDDVDEDDYISTQFATWSINYLLKGIAARDKNVRHRCARLIYHISTHLSTIDDDLFERLKTELNARSRDKEPGVRKEVANALSILQIGEAEEDTESVRHKLADLLQYDPSPMVRRTALMHVTPSNSTIAAIISRCRDEDAGTRKAVYKVLATHVKSFEQLGGTLLHTILNNGLRDSDRTVKASCVELIHGWVGDSPIALARLLAQLNVVKCPVAEVVVMECLERGQGQASSSQQGGLQLTFSDQYWRSLTPETALIVRCYGEIMGEFEDVAVEKLAYYLQLHTNQMITNMDETLDDAYIYVVSELLKICCTPDYSDPHGRRLMFTLVRNMITSVAVPEELIPPLVKLLRLICIDERDCIRVIYEIITDILDGLEGKEDETDSRDENEMSEEDGLFRHLKCLLIIRNVLESISLGWTNDAFTPMHGVISELILPSFSKYAAIGIIVANAVACLGLICLTSQSHAAQYLPQFLAYAGMSCAEDEELVEVSTNGFKAVFDLVLLYGASVFDVDAIELSEVMISGIKSPVKPVSVLAVQGCIKLLLACRMPDRNILRHLIVKYLCPDTAHDVEVYQALQIFMDVFPTIAPNKQMVSVVFGRVIADLFLLNGTVKEVNLVSAAQKMGTWLESEDKDNHSLYLQVAQDLLRAAMNKADYHVPLKTALQVCSKWTLGRVGEGDIICNLQQLISNINPSDLDVAATNALRKFEKALGLTAAAVLASYEPCELASFEGAAPTLPCTAQNRSGDAAAKVAAGRKRLRTSLQASIPTLVEVEVPVSSPPIISSPRSLSSFPQGGLPRRTTLVSVEIETPADRRTRQTDPPPMLSPPAQLSSSSEDERTMSVPRLPQDKARLAAQLSAEIDALLEDDADSDEE